MSSQVQYPNRATLRTFAASLIGLLPILPIIAENFGMTAIPWVATTLAITTGITRTLAHPQVEAWLHQHAAWLAAEPEGTDNDDADRLDSDH